MLSYISHDVLFLWKNVEIILEFIHRSEVDDKWGLVHIVAWHKLYNKLLSKAVMTKMAERERVNLSSVNQ